jgi:Na+/phosphate symporter
MKDEDVFFNPIRMISPKLNLEATRVEELQKAPVSDTFTLEEGLVVMMSKLIQMTRLLQTAFAKDCPDEMKECQLLAEQVHKQEKLLTANLVCAADSSPELCKTFMLFPGHLERVGDFLESILNCCRIKCAQHLEYVDKTYDEVQEMFDVVLDMLINFRDAIMVPNRFVLEHVIKLETKLEQMCNDRQLAHVDQLLSGSVAPKASSPYLDILDSTESLGRHIREMAERILSLMTASRSAV